MSRQIIGCVLAKDCNDCISKAVCWEYMEMQEDMKYPQLEID